MKILAFVDLHESKKALKKVIEKSKKADIIVCAGDLSIFSNNLEKIMFDLDRLDKTVLIIAGNHESDEEIEELSNLSTNIKNIHKKSFEIGDCLFLGYGGGGFAMVDQSFKKFSRKFEKIIEKSKAENVILVTHAPPYKTKVDNISGDSCGNKSIREFINKVKPIVAISGHLHETAGKKDVIGGTLVINPGPEGKIIEL